MSRREREKEYIGATIRPPVTQYGVSLQNGTQFEQDLLYLQLNAQPHFMIYNDSTGQTYSYLGRTGSTIESLHGFER